MDIVLTSFGHGMTNNASRSIFYNMPPLFLGKQNNHYRFHIDYASLFMFDRVIVDERSFERSLATDIEIYEKKRMSPSMFETIIQGKKEYAGVLTELHKSGRLITKNFDEVTAKSDKLLEKMTTADLKHIQRWRGPIESAVLDWSNLIEQLHQNRGYDHSLIEFDENEEYVYSVFAHTLRASGLHLKILTETLKNWKKKQPPHIRNLCRNLLKDYLSYINFNLILSFDCQAPFIDWSDMRYLYEEKFYAEEHVRTTMHKNQEFVSGSRRLFEFLFPYFIPKSPVELVRGVNDSRTERLRDFVKGAIEQGVDFDPLECIDILKRILRLEQKAIFRRNITGWATLPLGFIPVIGTPVQKGVEELVNTLWANRITNEYSWFYLINDLDVSMDFGAYPQTRKIE
jgi:hypothetical protein